MQVDSTPLMVANTYATMRKNLEVARKRVGRPLTLADKILLGHLVDPENQEIEPGVSQLSLNPDRVALQDVLGQTVMLNFMQTMRETVAVPTTVHCDHLIQARVEGGIDLVQSMEENREVYEFLKNAAAKYGAGFWGPGAGIIHPGGIGELLVPRSAHHRDRLAHAERGRAWGLCRRRRGCGRRGGDGGSAVGGALSEARGRLSHRREERLDGSEGRHPPSGGGVDRIPAAPTPSWSTLGRARAP